MKNISKTWIGAVTVMVLVGLTVGVFNKLEIGTILKGVFTSTDTIAAEFDQNYKLVAYNAGSDVKMAGGVVGTITDIAQTDRGTYRVTMQVNGDLRNTLG